VDPYIRACESQIFVYLPACVPWFLADMSRAAIKRGAIADWCDEQLYKGALPFWLGHSVDFEVGGFFNNLDCDSCLTETTKHVWLQGR